LRSKGVKAGYLTRIKELQAFLADDASIWGTRNAPPLLPRELARLAKLDNIDKHRVVHGTWHSADVLDISWPRPPQFVVRTAGFRGGPFENDALVGEIIFKTPLPYDWQPDQMYMKRLFPMQVAFADPAFVHSVRDVLAICLWGTEETLKLFEPAFGHDAPALPVTASLESEKKVFSDTLRLLL
jgi:hypothetical protein